MTHGTVSRRYGHPSTPPPAWAEVERRLGDAQLYWIVTVRRDGRPHAAPLCGVWRDGAFYFCTGEDEQKMRNLDHDPRVVVTAGSLGAAGWAHGKDIAVEGAAERVTDTPLLGSLADAWRSKYADDWVFEVRDGRFFEVSDQGDGQGDGALVLRVTPTKVLVFGDDHGQTTYLPG